MIVSGDGRKACEIQLGGLAVIGLGDNVELKVSRIVAFAEAGGGMVCARNINVLLRNFQTIRSMFYSDFRTGGWRTLYVL